MDDIRECLRTIDKDKLLHTHEDSIKEQEKDIRDKVAKLGRDIDQRVREIAKLKEEVIKVVMGESKFSQELLTEMIQTKETELAEIQQTHQSAQTACELMLAEIAKRKEVVANLDTWHDRFNQQGLMDKKAMLIDLVDRITVGEESVEVQLQFKIGTQDTHIIPEPDQDGAFDPNLATFLANRFVNWSGLDTQKAHA